MQQVQITALDICYQECTFNNDQITDTDFKELLCLLAEERRLKFPETINEATSFYITLRELLNDSLQ